MGRFDLLTNLDSLGNQVYPAVDETTIDEVDMANERHRHLLRAATAVTGNLTLTKSHYLLLVDTTSGAITLTLPSAADGIALYHVKKTSSDLNDVIVARAGSDTVDGGVDTRIKFQNSSMDIQSNGTDKWVVT